MSVAVFVDSNLWLYQLLDLQAADKSARIRAALIGIERLVISHQVLVEVGANLVKKSKLPEANIRAHLADLISSCEVVPVDGRVFAGACWSASAAPIEFARRLTDAIRIVRSHNPCVNYGKSLPGRRALGGCTCNDARLSSPFFWLLESLPSRPPPASGSGSRVVRWRASSTDALW